MIARRRKELMEKVPVRAVKFDDVKSGIDGTASSFHKCNDDGVNLFRCQLRRFHESGERHG